jgi:hypothetical protein
MTEPRTAFARAIALGILSDDESSPIFAGNFMFMGDDESGRHLFKHILTRAYIAPVMPAKESV